MQGSIWCCMVVRSLKLFANTKLKYLGGWGYFKWHCLLGNILKTWVLYRTHERKVTDIYYWFILFLLYCYLKYNEHCDALRRAVVYTHWVAWAMNEQESGVFSSLLWLAAPFPQQQGLSWALQIHSCWQQAPACPVLAWLSPLRGLHPILAM